MRRFILLALLAITSYAYGQWQYGGNVAGYYSPYTDELAVVNVGDAKTLIVWDKYNGGDYDIFAQYIDSAGYSYWGTDGMVVYEDDNIKQSYPAAIADGRGGAYIVWSDWRTQPDSGVALYGQHIDGEGNLLWPSEGQRLTYDTLYNRKTRIFKDDYGGIIMVYFRSSGIGAQRVDTTGRIMWDSAGVNLVTDPYGQWDLHVVQNSDSEYTACWIDRRFSFGDSSFYGIDIYMQKFNILGQTLWADNGIPAVHYPGDQGYGNNSIDISADGVGGVVVVWCERRRLAYNMILFADRFSPEGQSLWELNGQALGNDRVYEARECQAFIIGENFMFRWGINLNFIVSYLNQTGIPLGDSVVQLDSMGVINQTNAIMNPDGVFTYCGWTSAAKIDTSGILYWPNRPYSWYYSEGLKVISDGFDGLISVWLSTGYPQEIKISRIYGNGRVAGDTLTSIAEPVGVLPTSLKITSNYPNPFNGRTTIEYSLPYQTDVNLIIYNMLGQIVKSEGLMNLPPGHHSYSLQLSDQASGVYFVRMQTADGFIATKRIVMLK